MSPRNSKRAWRSAWSAASVSLLMLACDGGNSETDTRGVLDLFVSGPLDLEMEGLVYVISGADAGVYAGALPPQHPVMKLMLPPSQGYSIAVSGLGIPQSMDDKTRVACEGSVDFTIHELRTTEVDLDMDCEGVGTKPLPAVDASCSVASMLVAPRIQHVGGTIAAQADPFPENAPLRWTTPDNGVGRILSTGEDDEATYEFECVKSGFTEIVVEVLDGACTARAASAVVCMEENEEAVIEQQDP